MATLSEIQAANDTYQCDKCKKTFKAREVKLIEPARNITIFGELIMMVDKDGKIVGGDPDADKGDRLLACPHCETPHLFGFDRVNEAS